jgi:poly-gamma-glutamate biosynthesis protein PgsC/CapC
MSNEAFLVTGILASLLFFEVTGLSSGGIVTAGYVAASLLQGGVTEVVSALAVAGIAALVVKGLSRFFYLFGRLRFVLCLLAALMLKLAVEYAAPVISGELRVLGYLVPGLIAADFLKQGPVKTLLALATVTALVSLAAVAWGLR